MDKYTVDLDKVLNDFEYSEYSQEFSKKEGQQQDNSGGPSYSARPKVDTNVKHSINNVFHSLNEYLNSDITPKEAEVQNRPLTNKNVLSYVETNNLVTELKKVENSIWENKNLLPKNVNLIPETCSVSKKTDSVSNLDKISEGLEHNQKTNEDTYEFKENSKETSNIVTITTDAQLKTVTAPIITPETPPKTHESTKKHENAQSDITPQVAPPEAPTSPPTTLEAPQSIELTPQVIGFDTNVELDESQLEEYFQNLERELSVDGDTQIDNALNICVEQINENVNIKTFVCEDGAAFEPPAEGEQLNLEQKMEENEIVNTLKKNVEYLDDEGVEEDLGGCKMSRIDVENSECEATLCRDIENSRNTKSYENLSESNVLCDATKAAPKSVKEIDLINENKGFNTDLKQETPEMGPENDILSKNDTFLKDANKYVTDDTIVPSTNETASENTNSVINTENRALEHENTFLKQENQTLEAKNTSLENQIAFLEQNQIAELKNHQTSNFLEENTPNLSATTNNTPFKTEIQAVPFKNNEITPQIPEITHQKSDSKKTALQIIPQEVDPPNPTDDPPKLPQRPQNLNLDADPSKKPINLVGEPGSTPYNNAYKEIHHKSNLRSPSPTSSEISSSDSISSHTSSTDTVNDEPPRGAKLENSQNVQNNETESENATNVENASSSAPFGEEEGAVGPAPPQEGGLIDENEWLGKQAPIWIPDTDALNCMHCDMKFTVIKRRHHCRACGYVLCSKCCSLKYRLDYLDAESRVCNKCYDILNRDSSSNGDYSPNRGLGQPNPNNPLEYCSTVPPHQQILTPLEAPSVMVPVGVLKRQGSNKAKHNKSVMFCDGIRPGSDLTNLDTNFDYNETRNKKLEKPETAKVSQKPTRNNPFFDEATKSFIPKDDNQLPPTVNIYKSDVQYTDCINSSSLVETLKNQALIFSIQTNLFIHVKIINMDCCINKNSWCFTSEGLINVGQDEIVILLEVLEDENLVPKDMFYHFNTIYQDAVKGTSVKELGVSLHPETNFLGSKNHAGFVFIRSSFQCLLNIIKPAEPFLIGILIHRWETPWAKLFPLRLILRLGAEYRYYPSPIISTRNRDSVFVEIGHTIINLLADFRNFSYTLPQIRGLTIHMEDKNTTMTIPINRYDQIIKTLSNSSESILAFAGNFSTEADSHLVCIQDTQNTINSYSTHAINIHNKPRKVTGASFIVFNGALKSTSGLTAKSSIVEDGLMIQILPEHMIQIRESLRNMKNHTIKCGCINEESDEIISIVWGTADANFNNGITSPIDGMIMSGIPSIRVHNGKDFVANTGNRLIRWTEVFIIQNLEESNKNQDPVDISKISETIAKATCLALVKYLDLLISNSFNKISIRTTLHVDNVSYVAGSNSIKLPPIYMKSLDNELVPVLHKITSNNHTESSIILELLFRILNI